MATRLAASLPIPPDVPASQRAAQRAEELGYESLWIADSGGPDPFVVAAAAAAVTKSVRIGTAVIPAYTRTPPVISSAAASSRLSFPSWMSFSSAGIARASSH